MLLKYFQILSELAKPILFHFTSFTEEHNYSHFLQLFLLIFKSNNFKAMLQPGAGQGWHIITVFFGEDSASVILLFRLWYRLHIYKRIIRKYRQGK